MGVRSGWGDDWLRIWGVKAFLDGSLGSRTAEMLDGSGTARLPQPDLVDMIERCARAELNVCLHAIGDGAVRRALDALAPHRATRGAAGGRASSTRSASTRRTCRASRSIGVIASMQPIHAVADRELADALLAGRRGARVRVGRARARRRAAGVRIRRAGGDGRSAARHRRGDRMAAPARWHPELAVSRAAALRAYTLGRRLRGGHGDDTGALRPGKLCDMTVVDDGRVVATIVGGRVSWRRKPRLSLAAVCAGAR